MQEPLLFGSAKPASADTLAAIKNDLLHRTKNIPTFAARTFVFGEGQTGARVALVGESPGPPDAESGRPFMGPVGEVLEKMLKSVGLVRERCYLTNLVKFICNSDEVAADWLTFFAPYLHRELQLVRPQLVISFGNNPTRVLLRTKQSISQLRGQFHDYHGTPLLPTFNPAYLLRDPLKKREVWEDLKKVRDHLRWN
jgi:uracil-DNA glycosylase